MQRSLGKNATWKLLSWARREVILVGMLRVWLRGTAQEPVGFNCFDEYRAAWFPKPSVLSWGLQTEL